MIGKMLIAAMLAVPVVSSVCGAEGLGRIVYPGQNTFSFEEGTVEAWVKFAFDPAETTDGSWTPKGALFSFVIPKEPGEKGSSFSITCALKNVGKRSPTGSACYLRIGLTAAGEDVSHPVLVDCTGWGKDVWHHLAVTWSDGKTLKVYVDGKAARITDGGDGTTLTFRYSIVRDIPAAARMVLGTPVPWYGPNLLTVDEFRISSVARTPEALGFFKSPPSVDPCTLLLEDFEAAETKIEGGGITEGKHGKGFSFSP